jgi:hypothetical protein
VFLLADGADSAAGPPYYCPALLLALERGVPPLNHQQDLNLMCKYLARNPRKNVGDQACVAT